MEQHSGHFYGSHGKGQSAIEYLTTYAWALVIVAIVIVIIFVYLSLPSQIVPASCSFTDGFHCSDVLAGTNTLNQQSAVALILTNSQQAPLKNPIIYLDINNKNTTPVPCAASVLQPGNSTLCITTLPAYSQLGSLVSGMAYVNATYCGLEGGSYSSAFSCANGVRQSYVGTFTAHAQQALTQSAAIMVSSSAPNYGPSNVPNSIVSTTLFIFGYPLVGVKVNFTLNNSNSVLSSGTVLTNNMGAAQSTVSDPSNTAQKINIAASSYGLTGNAIVAFN